MGVTLPFPVVWTMSLIHYAHLVNLNSGRASEVSGREI